jgi:putative FmdB family regulatory protein
MPLYDYRCSDCRQEVEVMHAIGGSGPEACTACGGVMKKLLSPPAIHFKGSGWAKKDAATAMTGKGKAKTETSAKPADQGGKPDGDGSGGKSGSSSGEGSKATSSAGAKTD